MQNRVPDQKKEFINTDISNVSITLLTDLIKCPISNEIMFDPVITSCGHTFEEEAIKTWCKINENCPCCRSVIRSMTPNILAKNLIDAVLKQEPALQREQYFNFNHFCSAIKLYENEEKSNIEPLKRFINILSASPDKLNEVREEKGHEGETALAYLIEAWGLKHNDSILNSKILSCITVQGLSAKINGSQPSVAILAGAEESLEFLSLHHDLQSKITPEALNAKQDSIYLGATPTFWFTYRDVGRKILVSNEELRNKINLTGLNSIFEGNHCENEFLGMSAVYNITASIYRDENALLLLSDPMFQSKITSESFNAPKLGGPMQGATPVMWLTDSLLGLKLLQKSTELCNKITASGLNARVEKGIDRGISALFLLCFTRVGREILIQHSKLIKLINSETLNTILLDGRFRNKSAAYYLCVCDTGRELLRLHPELLDMIKPESINAITQDGSALAWFTGQQSIETLLQHPEFCDKINADVLNATIKVAPMIGKSAVYGLCKSPKGHQLLLKDARLRGLITKEALHTIVTHTEDPAEEGKTAADWLLNASTPESEKLLEDPLLRQKLGLPIKSVKDEEKVIQLQADKKIEIADFRYQYFSKMKQDKTPLDILQPEPTSSNYTMFKTSQSTMASVDEREEKSPKLLTALKLAVKKQLKTSNSISRRHFLSPLLNHFNKTPLDNWIGQLEKNSKTEKQVLAEMIRTFNHTVQDNRSRFSRDDIRMTDKRFIQHLDQSEAPTDSFNKRLLNLLKEFAPRELDQYGVSVKVESPLQIKKTNSM